MQLKQSDEPLNGNLNQEQGYQEDARDEFREYEKVQNDDFMNQFEEQPYVSSTPEPEKKSAKEKVSIACILLIFGFMSGWCLLSGAKGLFFASTHSMDEAFTSLTKGDVYEGQISYISPEICELKHTINFIPAGTEHFYLMFSPDGEHVVPIRASKKWDKQFTGNSVQMVSLTEKGIVREMDHEVKRELSSIVTAFAEEGIKVEPTLYVDLLSDRMCVMQIITGILIIVCVVYFVFIADKEVITSVKGSFSSPAALIVSVSMFVALGMLIYLMNMVGF